MPSGISKRYPLEEKHITGFSVCYETAWS